MRPSGTPYEDPIPGGVHYVCDRLLDSCVILGSVPETSVEETDCGEYLAPEQAASELGTTPYHIRREERKGTIPLAAASEWADHHGGLLYPAGAVYLTKVSGLFAGSGHMPGEVGAAGRLTAHKGKAGTEQAMRLEGSTIGDLLARHGEYVCRQREKEALRLRYGLRDEEKTRSCRETALRMGISTTRAAQLIRRGLSRLLAEEMAFQQWSQQIYGTPDPSGIPRVAAEAGEWWTMSYERR